MASRTQGAVWSRVISAPANVLSRMDVLTGMFEQHVSGQSRPAYHAGIAEYLKIYYTGKEKLPPDETNGNTPLVSAHEVAWYSWKATKDPRLPEMIAAGDVKNMVDLCYQTLALAEIDRDKIRRAHPGECRADSLAAARGAGSGRCGLSPISRRWSSRPGMRCGRYRPRACRPPSLA